MSQRPKREVAVVLCLFLILFLGTADNQVLSPLLPTIRARLGLTSHGMGMLFTIYAFCAGLSVLFWGPISDAFGRKRCLISGLLIFSAGSLLSYTAAAYSVLLAGRALTGIGASMLSLNTISFAADFFPYKRRGWAMGSIFSSYFAALILGVPIGSWVGDRFGWNAVFGLVALLGITMAATASVMLPELPHKTSDRFSLLLLLQGVQNYRGFLSQKSTTGAALCAFAASAGTMGFLAFLGTWLHDDFGLSTRQVGLVFLISGTAAFVASPLAGSLSDRIGKRTQFVGSNILLALLLVALPRMTWGIGLFAVFFSISLAAAFRQGPMEALLSEIVPPAKRGAFIAFKNSFSQLGIGLSGLASGLLFARGGYVSVCLLCTAANLAAVAGVFLTDRNQDL